MATMRALLLTLLCAGGAHAGSISLRGAIAKGPVQEVPPAQMDAKGREAGPCEPKALQNATQEHPEPQQSAGRSEPQNATHGRDGPANSTRGHGEPRNATHGRDGLHGHGEPRNATRGHREPANATRGHGEQRRNGTHGHREPKGEVLTLYHQTSAHIAELIFEGGFKPGTRGWCGGGIYFATKPWRTYHKAIGPNSHLGFIIEAQVDLGRVRHMPATCDRSMTADKMLSDGFDSIRFDPGDGEEIVVYSPESVLSVKHFTWS